MRTILVPSVLLFAAGCFTPVDVYDATPKASVLSAPTSAAVKPASKPTPAVAPTPAPPAEVKVEPKRPSKSKHYPCGCSCGWDCYCLETGNLCGDPACTCGKTMATDAQKLSSAANSAISQGKPLLIWVSEVCPPCERKMPEYIHVRLKEYDGYSGIVRDPCVIIGKPDGQGGLTRIATLPGIPTPEQVQAALNPPPPVFAPPPRRFVPMMRGWFGGGGCGGGG